MNKHITLQERGYFLSLMPRQFTVLSTYISTLSCEIHSSHDHNRYCFQKLPFGLRVSQDIFQMNMGRSWNKSTLKQEQLTMMQSSEQAHDKVLHKLMQVAEVNDIIFNLTKFNIKSENIFFFSMVLIVSIQTLERSATEEHATSDRQETYKNSWSFLLTCRCFFQTWPSCKIHQKEENHNECFENL